MTSSSLRNRIEMSRPKLEEQGKKMILMTELIMAAIEQKPVARFQGQSSRAFRHVPLLLVDCYPSGQNGNAGRTRTHQFK